MVSARLHRSCERGVGSPLLKSPLPCAPKNVAEVQDRPDKPAGSPEQLRCSPGQARCRHYETVRVRHPPHCRICAEECHSQWTVFGNWRAVVELNTSAIEGVRSDRERRARQKGGQRAFGSHVPRATVKRVAANPGLWSHGALARPAGRGDKEAQQNGEPQWAA